MLDYIMQAYESESRALRIVYRGARAGLLYYLTTLSPQQEPPIPIK
jgi:hypothetical protein